jgi:hypothetical protein
VFVDVEKFRHIRMELLFRGVVRVDAKIWAEDHLEKGAGHQEVEKDFVCPKEVEEGRAGSFDCVDGFG